jgi:hypothetical protein
MIIEFDKSFDKSQKINNNSYTRLEKFKAGKRIVEILKPIFTYKNQKP